MVPVPCLSTLFGAVFIAVVKPEKTHTYTPYTNESPMDRTNALIEHLATNVNPIKPLRPTQVLGTRWLVGALVTSVLVFSGLGIRPDLFETGIATLVALKTLPPLLFLILAVGATTHLMRPEHKSDGWTYAVIAVFTLLALCWAVTGLLHLNTPLLTEIKGKSLGLCLVLIPLLSLPPLVTGILALRHGAPSHPAIAGAWVGLGSGGIAAATYALHCTEDSPLFFLLWYTVGIVLAAGIGALAGNRWARW
jgi:hypothetical protein